MVYNKALNSKEIDNLTNQITELLSIPKPSRVVDATFSYSLYHWHHSCSRYS